MAGSRAATASNALAITAKTASFSVSALTIEEKFKLKNKLSDTPVTIHCIIMLSLYVSYFFKTSATKKAVLTRNTAS